MLEYVFVADMFAEQYSGGAELTSQAIIEHGHNKVISKILCNQITQEFINNNINKHWIIGNFSNLSFENKLSLCRDISYSIIEYDYKFCDYRSIERHLIEEEKECDCITKEKNKINLAFYGLAKKVWFMSEVQRNIFLKNVKTLKKQNTEVLNSVFSSGDLRFIDSIKNNKKNNKFLIIKSDLWVKGFEQTIQYAKSNKINYEVVSNLPYHELLIKLSTSMGLLFLPKGADTCPRLVMEAQMLGCKLILNDLVQHKDEEWAKNSESCREHMKTRGKVFWSFYE